MPNYKLSNEAKEDLIRIYHYGVRRFGSTQADKYYDQFFENFEVIASRPFSFEAIDHLRSGYRRCVSGVDSIIFRIENDTVEIMAIVGRQNIENII